MRAHHTKHKIGVGLRHQHFPYLETRPETEVSWFEALTENHIDSRGRPWDMLMKVRQDYPVALHGVSMNIGSTEGIRLDYLEKMREMIERVEPFIVSDHICWTGNALHNMHDLLPLPYTKESLQLVVDNIDFAQNYLHSPLVFENISAYMVFKGNEISEVEFLNEVSKRTGCGLLLDLTNLYINSVNHNFDPRAYLNQLSLNRVVQLHLAGPQKQEKFLFDTHSTDVPDEVWSLLRYVAPQLRHLPVLIERDDNIPDFTDCEMDVMKAAFILESDNETRRTSIVV